jgi:hypothetical protein
MQVRPGFHPSEKGNITCTYLYLHIGALHCADSFHSRERHTVPSGSDSRGPVNPGMPIPILKGHREPLLSLFNEYTVH